MKICLKCRRVFHTLCIACLYQDHHSVRRLEVEALMREHEKREFRVRPFEALLRQAV